MNMPELPVNAILPELRQLLAKNHAVILEAETGAGKSTRIPLALLNEKWRAGKKIIMLEPRRLAARSVATFMAQLLDEQPGQRVGWQIRNDYRPGSVIEVVTEGILTRRLQSDPELQDAALIIFDEFHERSIHADLALALCREVQTALRPDLKLLVMSATLESEPLCEVLETSARLHVQGRLFPVVTRHLPRPVTGNITTATARAVHRALAEENGDILVFLPGVGEIRRTQEILQAELPQTLVTTLYGGLSFSAQQQALAPAPAGYSKVVLATNIAETSLTIEGVGCVVDSGLVRKALFDPATGMTRLVTRRISKSSAEQRKGRAGRVRPGICFRLWSEGEETAMKEQEDEEIRTTDLSRLVLELAAWGVTERDGLPWLTPPPEGNFRQSQQALTRLGFLDARGITPLGRRAVELGVSPPLAALLLRGNSTDAIWLTALLGERDIFRRDSGADLTRRLEALAAFCRDRQRATRSYPLLRQAAEQVVKSGKTLKGKSGSGQGDKSPAALLALAWPERVAHKRGETRNGRAEFLLAGGGSCFLPLEDPLSRAEWLVVADLDGERSGGRIYLAAEYSRKELEMQFAGELEETILCNYLSGKQRLEVEKVQSFGSIVLERQRITRPEPKQIEAALLEAVRVERLTILPWTKKLSHWLDRARWLASQREDWPDVSEENLLCQLDQWLAPFLAGLTSIGGLAEVNLRCALQSLFTPQQLTDIKREAPTDFTTPSGRTLPILYRKDQGPVVSVRLQEMFGQTDSPRLAWKRIPLVFELLSPAGRPIQTTADLAGFWVTSYKEVAREMRGRYPKHRWPEEPLLEKPGRSLKRK